MRNGKDRDMRERVSKDEFVWLRALAIIAIVAHHIIYVFVCWPPNSGVNYGVPGWFEYLGFALKCVGLGAFTFMAGYFSVGTLERNNALSFVRKKVGRILFPCLLFAVAYYFLFPSMMVKGDPVGGTHLWYLPMIFVCFLIVGCKVYVRPRWFGVVLGLALYMACIVGRASDIFAITRTMGAVVVFIPVFLVGYLMGRGMIGFSNRLVFVLVLVGVAYPSSWFGCMTFRLLGFAAALHVVCRFLCKVRIPQFIRKVNDCSFGIYLCHQFVINASILLLVSIGLVESISWWLYSLVFFPATLISSLLFVYFVSLRRGACD